MFVKARIGPGSLRIQELQFSPLESNLAGRDQPFAHVAA